MERSQKCKGGMICDCLVAQLSNKHQQMPLGSIHSNFRSHSFSCDARLCVCAWVGVGMYTGVYVETREWLWVASLLLWDRASRWGRTKLVTGKPFRHPRVSAHLGTKVKSVHTPTPDSVMLLPESELDLWAEEDTHFKDTHLVQSPE